MNVKFTEEQTRLHNKLLTDINDRLDLKSEEYAAFRLQITQHLGGNGVLERCQNLLDMFKQLTKRTKLGVLNYAVLKDAFGVSNNHDIVGLIEEREQEIRITADVPTNKPISPITDDNRKPFEYTYTNTKRKENPEETRCSTTTLKEKGEEFKRSDTTLTKNAKGSRCSTTTLKEKGEEFRRSNTTVTKNAKGYSCSKSTIKRKGDTYVETKSSLKIKGATPSDSKIPFKRNLNKAVLSAKKNKVARHESEDIGAIEGIEDLEYYDTTSKTGFLLILHVSEDRQGLDGAIGSLTGFFEDTLQFDVVIVPRASNQDENELPGLTSGQVTAALVTVRNYLNKEENARRYYCFMCIVLSHVDNGVIKTKDGSYKVDSMRNIFNNTEMKQFAAKPKVFVIQACQASEDHTSLMVDDEADTIGDNKLREDEQPIEEADALASTPNDAGFPNAFAPIPDHFVLSGNCLTDSGTNLTIRLVEIFQRWYTRLHLEDMMISVRNKTSQTNCLDQNTMPFTWSTLTKRLQFTVGRRTWQSKSTQRDRQPFTYENESVLIDSVLNS